MCRWFRSWKHRIFALDVEHHACATSFGVERSVVRCSVVLDVCPASSGWMPALLMQGCSWQWCMQFVAIDQAGAQAGVSKELMDKAQDVMIRMLNKLEGKDFRSDRSVALTLQEQVQKLIQRATSNELLCQSYIGWCPFW